MPNIINKVKDAVTGHHSDSKHSGMLCPLLDHIPFNSNTSQARTATDPAPTSMALIRMEQGLRRTTARASMARLRAHTTLTTTVRRPPVATDPIVTAPRLLPDTALANTGLSHRATTVDQARTTTLLRRLVATDRATTTNLDRATTVLAPTDPRALADMDRATTANLAPEPMAPTPTARGPLAAMTRVVMAGLALITMARAPLVTMEEPLPLATGRTSMDLNLDLATTARAQLGAMGVDLPVVMGPSRVLATMARAPPVAMDRDPMNMARVLILMALRALEAAMLQAVAATVAVELVSRLGDPTDMTLQTRWAVRAWSRRPDIPSETSGERPWAFPSERGGIFLFWREKVSVYCGASRLLAKKGSHTSFCLSLCLIEMLCSLIFQ